jgi:serine protease Do
VVTDTAILPQIVSNLGPNKTVNLTLWRNNQTLEITAVTMPASNIDKGPAVATAPEAQKSIDKLGIVVSPLTAKQLKQFNGKLTGGLLIENATSDAQFAGITAGDVIIGIANTPVNTIEEFTRLVANYRAGQTIALKILRNTGNNWITLFIPVTISGTSS